MDVHRFAEEGMVVRGLLRIEDSLTYDAVALRPYKRALGQRIRERNRLLIGLCSTIIRDDARIRRAKRELGKAHAGRAGLDTAELHKTITDATADVKKSLEAIKQERQKISLADMFEMQVLMNHLSQLSEMSTTVVSAANAAISSMARNVKR